MVFLIIFAFFVATVLLSIVLERLIRMPGLVSIAIFALYLIVLTILFATGVVTNFALSLLIAIIFAVIAFITAWIARFIRCICRRFLGSCCTRCPENPQNLLSNNSNNCLGYEDDETLNGANIGNIVTTDKDRHNNA